MAFTLDLGMTAPDFDLPESTATATLWPASPRPRR